MSVLEYDPAGMRALATELEQSAESIREQAARIRKLPGSMMFECPAGTEFDLRSSKIGAEEIPRLASDLERLADYVRSEALIVDRLQEAERRRQRREAGMEPPRGSGRAK